jgi:hypothetical protein
MTDTNFNKANKENKKDFFHLFLEIFGFIRIVASPFLTGLDCLWCLYFKARQCRTYYRHINCGYRAYNRHNMGDKNLEKEKHFRLSNNCDVT